MTTTNGWNINNDNLERMLRGINYNSNSNSKSKRKTNNNSSSTSSSSYNNVVVTPGARKAIANSTARQLAIPQKYVQQTYNLGKALAESGPLPEASGNLLRVIFYVVALASGQPATFFEGLIKNKVPGANQLNKVYRQVKPWMGKPKEMLGNSPALEKFAKWVPRTKNLAVAMGRRQENTGYSIAALIVAFFVTRIIDITVTSAATKNRNKTSKMIADLQQQFKGTMMFVATLFATTYSMDVSRQRLWMLLGSLTMAALGKYVKSSNTITKALALR